MRTPEGNTCVLGAKHSHTWPPSDVVRGNQVARVEAALGPDPYLVADPAVAVEPALEVGRQ